jgi:hypothetical protein
MSTADLEAYDNVLLQSADTVGEEVINSIESQILETMEVFPKISPTMLQSGLGPSLKPALWRPALRRLIQQGRIVQKAEFPPAGSQRTRPFTVLELVQKRQNTIKVPPIPRHPSITNIAVPPPPEATV